jgi:hypothetical protein
VTSDLISATQQKCEAGMLVTGVRESDLISQGGTCRCCGPLSVAAAGTWAYPP